MNEYNIHLSDIRNPRDFWLRVWRVKQVLSKNFILRKTHTCRIICTSGEEMKAFGGV